MMKYVSVSSSQFNKLEGDEFVKLKLNAFLKSKNKMIYIAIVAFMSILCGFFPYMSYVYNKNRYGILNLDFVIGKDVAGGTVHVESNLFMQISLLLIVAIFILALAYNKMNTVLADKLIAFFAFFVLATNVVYILRRNSVLKELKQIKVEYGAIIIFLLVLVILIQSLYNLWKKNVLFTLDFLIVPGMLYFIINNYIPMVGILIAFKKIDYRVGIIDSPWVGFENFKVLFPQTGSFFQSDAFIITRNTLLYNLAFITLSTIMGVVVGICLADLFSSKWKKFFQTSILLPQLISMVIVAYIGYAFFSNEAGLINSMLASEDAINFYASPKYWPFILVFVFVWKQIGYSAIIFLSSIVGIDHSLYEAAKVDGANKMQQISYITLPMLKPTIMTLVLLQVGRIFYSDFGLFYQVPMNSGALYNVTNTIDTFVYRALMVSNNISTASAVSTYQAVVGFAIVFTVNMLVKKFDRENALF